jgi:starch synthase
MRGFRCGYVSVSILIGHPRGNPNSHHAALAHLEAGRLEAFCVPWMPSMSTLRVLERATPWRSMAQRLSRRRFAPLANAPTVQGRTGELRRLLTRALNRGDERLAYEANDWLMRTMRRECRRPAVTAVHAYEDCSLWQFQEAKRLGKACVYDMPIGYYPAWQQTQADLIRQYADWLPTARARPGAYARPEQKRDEMSLADVVLVPSSFVEHTIRMFHSDKALARIPFGVELEFWQRGTEPPHQGPLRFIYAGQLSIRKGTPLLLKAWEAADLQDAELELVGTWLLADGKRAVLPSGVACLPPCSPSALRERYRAADVFVFPSFFEGLGLVLLEAIACGLPAIASHATGAPDVLTGSCGRLVPTGDLDALVETLRWFSVHRESIPAMRLAARARAEMFSWQKYRSALSTAVRGFC